MLQLHLCFDSSCLAIIKSEQEELIGLGIEPALVWVRPVLEGETVKQLGQVQVRNQV